MGETVAMQPMMPPPSVGPVAPTKPQGRVALVLGAVLLVGGIVLGIVLVVTGVLNVANAVEDYQRVPVPGGGSVELTETGTYHLYFEGPSSLVNDLSFNPPQLAIFGPGGAQLAISVSAATSTYDFGERHGRSIGTFRADEPGTYRIRTISLDGEGDFDFERTGEIAVTRDSPFRSIALVLVGVFGGGAMVLVGIILLIVGGVRRSRSKQAAYVGAGAPAWGGAPTGGWTPPAPQPWTPPAPQAWVPPGPQPWTPPPSADPPPPPGWVPPPSPSPPADPPSWPPSSDGPIS